MKNTTAAAPDAGRRELLVCYPRLYSNVGWKLMDS
jgi:hypothetical protein